MQDLRTFAMVVGGGLGAVAAIPHGWLTQKYLVRPVLDSQLPHRRLTAALLQFSTFAWFLGGVVIVSTVMGRHVEAERTAAFLVGPSYLFGAMVNFWSTRGRHFGWVVYGAAGLLISLGCR